MATINLTLSRKEDKETHEKQILIEFIHGREIHQRAKTNIFVAPEYWNDGDGSLKIPDGRKWRMLTADREQITKDLQSKCDRLNEIKSLVNKSFNEMDKSRIAKDWLKTLINDYNFPKNEEEAKSTSQFFDVFSKYIAESEFSLQRKRHFQTIWRTLKRFELFTKTTLSFDTITEETLKAIKKYYLDEHIYCEEDADGVIKNKYFADILAKVPESRKPKQRGKNATVSFLCHIRAFLKWAIDNGHMVNDPFRKFTIGTATYGTPIYITKEERNHLYRFDFSNKPRLARQRDIFVFQCVIGCRVSDLWAMTRHNIVDGEIQYIPRKTKEEKPITVSVPMNAIAKEIVERYKDDDRSELLPFTSQQHYNIDIKEIFRLAGLTRMVTVLNPTSGDYEQRPICDVASSHMARRCFIGHLYKTYKDPNAIGALSGHVEGSRAFSRYREIDKEIKKEMVKELE